MQKKYFLFLMFLFLSCQDETEADKVVNSTNLNIEIERFDQLFYKVKSIGEMHKLSQQYPFLFPTEIPLELMVEKANDTLLNELNNEVQSVFSNTIKLKEELESLFKYTKYYFKSAKTPRVITLINEVDDASRAIYNDSIALISLDNYLGKEHRFYVNIPLYKTQFFESQFIVGDLAENYLLQKTPFSNSSQFVEKMVYFGKITYAKKLLLPNVKEAAILDYQEEQYNWAIANEYNVWSYFVENELLFSTDSKLDLRFLQAAPFSKFYLELDAESPGRIGCFIGYRIVDEYMKTHKLSLEELLTTSSKLIYEQSKYKPSK